MSPDELRQARRTIELAVDIAAGHLSRPVLGYVLDRAEAEARVAKNALASIDPSDQAGIMRLQNQVRRYEELVAWLDQVLAKAEEYVEGQNMEERTEPIE